MKSLDEIYGRDQNVGNYIKDHQRLLEMCSEILDDRSEELENAKWQIHDLERRVKELEKEITTIW